MNMMNVAKYLGKVNLYVVHGVDEATILENDENEILLLCEGHAESGESSGVGGEAHVEGGEEGITDVVEGAVEVQNDYAVDVDNEDARDVENDDALEVQKEDLLDVDNEDWLDVEHDDALEVEKEDSVDNEDVEHEDAEDDEVAVEVENEDEVEDVSEEALEVDNEAEIEVKSEQVLHVDIQDGGEVDSEEEMEVEVEVNSDDEAGMDDLSGDEYVDEDSEKETQQCRGLSDDDCESDKLLTPENSASEEDDNDDTIYVGPFSKYAKQKSMVDYKWEVGTIFTNREEFKDAIRRYVVHAERNLKFIKNDNRRVRVTCMGGQGKCPWLAYCGYLPSRKIWQLKKIIDTHSCSRQLNIKLMNAKWLSQEIDRSLVENPSLKVNDIRTKALRKWNTNVSISKARRAKLIATRQVEGDFKEQYKRVYDYGHELLRCNPGSTVQIKVDFHNGDPIFQRMYVCLKACKDSFISCRPIICLDGCFLKGVYKGELLTVVGRDPNDQMLPLAYAVVEVENKDSWTWFLQLLIEDLGGTAGLVLAIQELLPRAEQRYCLRHLYANFRKRFGGQVLKNLMWSAATTTYPQAWEREMLKIKEVNVEAYKYLIAIPPRFWSRSRFTGQPMCDTLDNNITEAFNSVLIHARGKSIITMMEDIRVYLMKRWATNRSMVASMDFTICPKIKNRLQKECNLSRFWLPSWAARKIFEVRHSSSVGNKFTVDLDTKECSCRKWMISGIPCCHAIAAMNYCNVDPDNFIPTCFRRSTYEEVYASIIFPLNGPQLWQTTNFNDVLPPLIRKLPGRPKKKRKLEAWELTKDNTQMRVGGHRKKCTICRQTKHNRNNCPLRPQPAEATQPPEATQPTQTTQSPETTQPSQPPPSSQSSRPTKFRVRRKDR
ncbi:uncharacterized protein LOC128196726 [Vigna angularis]|uniref:uncharacterized protein LOC128196726 n=1 Tax=Phaseolus angularis TaxID=3914 RepID=UPI0022B3D55A|nr:uncharacterized protein LOC128196726 [Vigna angularis]